jgi:DNA adenine methylase
MLPELLKHIPEHRMYCEVFVGGGCLFWNKKSAEVNIVNDKNINLTKFYSACKNNRDELSKRISASILSRDLFNRANAILSDNSEEKDDIETAWAVWYSLVMGYCGKMNGVFNVCGNADTKAKIMLSYKLKREEFLSTIQNMVDNTIVECDDAIKVILRHDSVDTFFYCDPPYFNSDCGHYRGYTENDFENLLGVLAGIKGKFLLSSYQSAILNEFVVKNKWKYKEIKRNLAISNKYYEHGKAKSKIECLTYNYDVFQTSIFDVLERKEEENEQARVC